MDGLNYKSLWAKKDIDQMYRDYLNPEYDLVESEVEIFERRRTIAYSIDTLIPGFYFWWGDFTIRIGR